MPIALPPEDDFQRGWLAPWLQDLLFAKNPCEYEDPFNTSALPRSVLYLMTALVANKGARVHLLNCFSSLERRNAGIFEIEYSRFFQLLVIALGMNMRL
jgi:hypothetical protein